jgi:hypothetical protein
LISVKYAIGIIVADRFKSEDLARYNDGVIVIEVWLVRTTLDGLGFFPEKKST